LLSSWVEEVYYALPYHITNFNSQKI